MFPQKLYQLQKTLFDKLDSFIIPYYDDQKLFKNLEKLDFDSIRVQEDKFRDTDNTTWVGKHVLISVSNSSNLIEKPIFHCNFFPRTLVESFVDARGGLLTRSKVSLKVEFLEIQTSVKSKLNKFFFALNLLIYVAVVRNQFWILKMGVWRKKKSKMCRHRSYKYKKINILICSVTLKDITTFFQSLASTAQNTTLIY